VIVKFGGSGTTLALTTSREILDMGGWRDLAGTLVGNGGD
jgi:hypothetical protein